MFSLRCSVANVLPQSAKIALVIGVALSVAGCASDDEYRRKVYGDPQQQQMAMRGPAPVEVEDDGLPPQVAPRANRRIEADNPNEPYSPNYGGGSGSSRPQPVSPAPAAEPQVPPSRQQAYRTAPVVPAVAGWRRISGQ